MSKKPRKPARTPRKIDHDSEEWAIFQDALQGLIDDGLVERVGDLVQLTEKGEDFSTLRRMKSDGMHRVKPLEPPPS